jgi:hypothetical protein
MRYGEMAVTKANDDRPVNSGIAYDPETGKGTVNEVAKGASGGLAPEGHGVGKLLSRGHIGPEGVALRSDKEEAEMWRQADEFMKAKVEFAKKVDESAKKVAKGEFDTPLKDVLEKQAEDQKKEADKKPTVAGGDPTGLDGPFAQSAKETEKQELKGAAEADVPEEKKEKQAEVKKDDKVAAVSTPSAKEEKK